uniref:Mitochondrial carrier protein n=1 Tax=Phaeomonas parva TaxID=124430 RepID=A0A7S1TQZ9_9STRA|mmetsp:Transcript_13877/g.41238  ORF Transcript_13877/g.41238 Transcript_13877/m.41238 type:complete len:290 (+) Transcript_13877:177-1046(+)
MPEKKKRAIAYEKLIIGPVTTIGEMTMGGHWLEMLKVQKQAGTYKTYSGAAAHMWKELGFSGFYKGFWPAGFVQGCYKGLPVLFVQGEVKYQLNERGYVGKPAEVAAGVTAGVVQGAMVSPTQRVKVLVATNAKAGAVSLDIIRKVIADEGVGTLFKGTGVMMLRRGVDWGVRFYGKSLITGWMLAGTPEGTKLGIGQQFCAGLFGGAFSALSQPLDVWVANAQKHRAVPITAAECFSELMAESASKGFFSVWFRGIEMRIVHSSYHTAWMAGLGAYIADYYRTNWVKK